MEAADNGGGGSAAPPPDVTSEGWAISELGLAASPPDFRQFFDAARRLRKMLPRALQAVRHHRTERGGENPKGGIMDLPPLSEAGRCLRISDLDDAIGTLDALRSLGQALGHLMDASEAVAQTFNDLVRGYIDQATDDQLRATICGTGGGLNPAARGVRLNGGTAVSDLRSALLHRAAEELKRRLTGHKPDEHLSAMRTLLDGITGRELDSESSAHTAVAEPASSGIRPLGDIQAFPELRDSCERRAERVKSATAGRPSEKWPYLSTCASAEQGGAPTLRNPRERWLPGGDGMIRAEIARRLDESAGSLERASRSLDSYTARRACPPDGVHDGTVVLPVAELADAIGTGVRRYRCLLYVLQATDSHSGHVHFPGTVARLVPRLALACRMDGKLLMSLSDEEFRRVLACLDQLDALYRSAARAEDLACPSFLRSWVDLKDLQAGARAEGRRRGW